MRAAMRRLGADELVFTCSEVVKDRSLALTGVLRGASALARRVAGMVAPPRDELEAQLAMALAQLDALQAAERKRRHDARSAVPGLIWASSVLVDEDVPLAERRELQHLLAAEVGRLALVLGLEPTPGAGPRRSPLATAKAS